MPKVSRLEEKALSFWAERVKEHQVVVTSKEIPGEYLKKILVSKGLAFLLRKGLYLLKKPEHDPQEQVYLNYWKIIKKILEKYVHWSIRGEAALNLYLGSQKIPEILQVRSSREVKIKIKLPFGLEMLIINDRDFNPNTVGRLKIMGQELNIDIPEFLLFEYKKVDANFLNFVKTQAFDYRIVEVLYQEKARPVVAKRLVGILDKAGRSDLAQKIQSVIEEYTGYRVGRQQIEKARPPEPALKPWSARLGEMVSRYEEKIADKLLPQIGKIRKRSLTKLLAAALENKKYDLYNSTTIEGYRITPEEVSEVLFKYSGNKKIKEKKTKELREKMAILGYSYAFDFILSRIKADFKKTRISQDLIKDLYFQLFKPSADLKIIDRFSLASYRREQNYIRASRHVPPAPEKLIDLMEEFENSVNSVKDPIIKAILSHYVFVYIHPYVDGNGRCARLLMNYILLTSGYPWITIRAEDRERYFKTLEKAHLSENILPFAEFIVSFLR
ncbi:MAG: Fic family protein [Candidatus Margulisiibacteriota bacterium]